MLHGQLATLVQGGKISQVGADVIELIGDLQAFLPLTMESAPFIARWIGRTSSFLHDETYHRTVAAAGAASSAALCRFDCGL